MPTPQQAALNTQTTKINEARDTNILTKIGATTYTFTREAIVSMPQGDNTPIDKLILQFPVLQLSCLQSEFSREKRGRQRSNQRTPAGPILPDQMPSAAGSPTPSEKASNSRYHRPERRYRRITARPFHMGHVYPCKRHREGGDDRSCGGLTRDVDGLGRKKPRTIGRAGSGGARAPRAGRIATFAQAYEKLRNGSGPVVQLMEAAASEVGFSANLRADGLKERIAWQLERIEMAAGRKISRGTGILATIGATAPFVGLFGTVWGIMDSFIGISRARTTNLAVVAPGIAEALLATALGLVAAIPAVMIYNVLARSTTHYRALIGDAATQVMKLVSRDLDGAKLPLTQAAE